MDQDNNKGSLSEVRNKVTIDIQTLKKKQEILISYYQLQQQSEIVQLLSSWPNQEIKQTLSRQPLVHHTNNAKYVGEICNEMFHGYGLLIYDEPKGRFYEGQFQNNCKHGDGVQFIGGDTYIGKFINNKPEDINGVFFWKNGDLFIGGFINGMKHGQGRWESGQDYYIGTWKLNKPEGSGTIHTHASQYIGDVKNGYKHGRGIQIFLNGDSYEGQYANGKPEGDGIYKWKNGAIYKGQFKNGIRYGYGQWTFGQEKYEGQYVNDRRNGQGLYKWGSQSYYKGHFVDDKRHGFGEMHWNQNAFYRGQWNEGIQSGSGQLWQDGKMISKGIFQDGKLVKSTPSHPKVSKNRYQKQQKQETIKEISDSKHRFKRSPKQIKYPQIQGKKKLNSHYSYLSQIDEKDNSHKSRKSYATNSFSHSSTNQASQKHKKPSKIESDKPVKETVYLPTSHKKKLLSQKSPSIKKIPREEPSKSSHPNSSPKRVVDLSETQLGPIKWKNFRHMNQTRNSVAVNSNLPQI